ncbi:SEC-C metal-binding domain-containing protein [Archangium sp.]|uniref:SEC-C metal-binding domain-containing protein n=1 Tax=Archangium sp. TaxID=1872627 RepID=UPI00389A4C24
MARSNARARVRRLLEFAEALPEPVSEDILSLGTEAVEPLVEILRDEPLADVMAPGEGFPPVHAARLLARLGAPGAVSPLVRRLMQTEPGELLYDTLLYALGDFGPGAVPEALGALALARDEDERLGLLCVLARSGHRDERILAALLEQLQGDVTQGAMNLSRYGDPRALPALARKLDDYPVEEDNDDLFANQTAIELASAIEGLGGRLDAAQRAKVERAQRSRRRLSQVFQCVLDELHPPPRERPAPGEPCWCGSGRRYEACHLDRDHGR